MTIAEIETLLQQLQSQVDAYAASMSNYATTDDLNALTEEINVLQKNNTVLQNSVAALTTNIKKIDHLSRLNDVEIDNITEDDILQYGSDGLWHNIKLSKLGINTGSTGSNSLASLTDVQIVGVFDGQSLVYSAANGKWTNSLVDAGDVDLSNYLTITEAEEKYLAKTGGEIDWLTVNGLTTINDNLLVKKGITMYDE